jgi:predicted alpha/beta-fold hydrolase
MKPYLSTQDFQKYETVLQTCTSGQQLEEGIVAPMHGFKDKYDYYSAVSLAGKLRQIKVPTFAIHARDDYVCTDDFLPFEEFDSKDSNILLALTNKGTHACHLTGKIVPRNFYAKPFIGFLNFLETRNKYQ